MLASRLPKLEVWTGVWDRPLVASTGKLEQVDEQIVSIIGQVRNVSKLEIVLNP